jgi:hypothetical protein
MAVSLNALFDIPTRDEKEKKRAQGQATVDRISEMNLADELTKGQLKYAKELGLEFTEKELDAIRERNVKALKTAGDATPEVTEARGKTSNLMTQANDWLEKNTGIRMGNPEAKAKVEANKARLDTQKFRNEATQAKAAEPFQGQLGTVSAQESISKSKLNEMTNVYGIDAAGDVAQTADLTRKAQQANAMEYLDQGSLREMQNQIGLLEAQRKQEYLRQIAGDPLRLELQQTRLAPEDFGYGADQLMPKTPMTPLGQQPAARPTGMLQRGAGQTTTAEALRKALMEMPSKLVQ